MIPLEIKLKPQTPIKTLPEFYDRLTERLEVFIGKAVTNQTTQQMNVVIKEVSECYLIENDIAKYLKLHVETTPDPTRMSIKTGNYTHDCEECRYLGTGFLPEYMKANRRREEDYYFCTKTKSLIIRNGNHPANYKSLPLFVVIEINKSGTYVEKDNISEFLFAYQVCKWHGLL